MRRPISSSVMCFACRAVVVHDVEIVARLRCAVQTQHLYRCRGPCLGHLLAVLVEHGLHAARICSRENHIAYMERSALYHDRSHVAAALVECRLDDGTLRLLVGVGLQVEHLGLQKHLLQQLVQIYALLGRYVLTLVFSAPLLDQIVHLGQLLLDVVGVCARLVDLVYGEDHGHTCGLRVVDGLDRLRHDVVVGRNDDDGHVGDLGTARTHRREGLVTRRVEEGDLLTVEVYRVGTDVLRDAAGLTLDDVRLADVVQKRGLTVVDVSHDRHDRRTRHEILLLVGLGLDGLLYVYRHELDLEAELLGHDNKGLGVETLVDRYHESEVHAGRDDLHGRDVHHRGQLAYGDELRDLEDRTLLLFAFHLLAHLLAYLLTLLLAVLGTLVLGALRREAGQRILYLL